MSEDHSDKIYEIPAAPTNIFGVAYKDITIFFKSLFCERIKLVCASLFVTLLILIDFTGISMSWCVIELGHPVVSFLIVSRKYNLE